MKAAHPVSVVCLIAIACSASGASDVNLEPNATLRLEFPDLPDTLMTKASGEKQPARLTAQLPENYSREGKFPLFIFLTGGGGGRGDAEPSSRGVVGPRDFICVNLPQFKRAVDKNEPYRGLTVSMEDFETVSRAYQTMLQKLFDAVPNITPERSALGVIFGTASN